MPSFQVHGQHLGHLMPKSVLSTDSFFMLCRICCHKPKKPMEQNEKRENFYEPIYICPPPSLRFDF